MKLNHISSRLGSVTNLAVSDLATFRGSNLILAKCFYRNTLYILFDTIKVQRCFLVEIPLE